MVFLCDFKQGIKDGIDSSPKHVYQQSRYGFFIDLSPINGAIDAVNWLKEHFDVWILTRPSIMNITSYSEKAYWVQKHFGIDMLNKLIMSPDKSLVKGDYLIDDSILDNQDKFDGVLIRFSIDPYFNTWNDVLQYFEEIIND